jgi:hypothetical protein
LYKRCATHAAGNPQGLNPFTAGPRYFFYPFDLLSWILIWLAASSMVAVRVAISAAMIAAIIFALPEMSRRHDAVDWRAQIAACVAASGPYDLPIHYDGDRRHSGVPLSAAMCVDNS